MDEETLERIFGVLALYSAVCIGVTYFDDIKGYIQSKFRHEEKES